MQVPVLLALARLALRSPWAWALLVLAGATLSQVRSGPGLALLGAGTACAALLTLLSDLEPILSRLPALRRVVLEGSLLAVAGLGGGAAGADWSRLNGAQPGAWLHVAAWSVVLAAATSSARRRVAGLAVAGWMLPALWPSEQAGGWSALWPSSAGSLAGGLASLALLAAAAVLFDRRH